MNHSKSDLPPPGEPAPWKFTKDLHFVSPSRVNLMAIEALQALAGPAPS
jgi:hypothetical protein